MVLTKECPGCWNLTSSQSILQPNTPAKCTQEERFQRLASACLHTATAKETVQSNLKTWGVSRAVPLPNLKAFNQLLLYPGDMLTPDVYPPFWLQGNRLLVYTLVCLWQTTILVLKGSGNHNAQYMRSHWSRGELQRTPPMAAHFCLSPIWLFTTIRNWCYGFLPLCICCPKSCPHAWKRLFAVWERLLLRSSAALLTTFSDKSRPQVKATWWPDEILYVWNSEQPNKGQGLCFKYQFVCLFFCFCSFSSFGLTAPSCVPLSCTHCCHCLVMLPYPWWSVFWHLPFLCRGLSLSRSLDGRGPSVCKLWLEHNNEQQV